MPGVLFEAALGSSAGEAREGRTVNHKRGQGPLTRVPTHARRARMAAFDCFEAFSGPRCVDAGLVAVDPSVEGDERVLE